MQPLGQLGLNNKFVSNESKKWTKNFEDRANVLSLFERTWSHSKV